MKVEMCVAVGVVMNDKGQIFVTKRKQTAHKGGFWEFPGGKIEHGETARDALKRELYEEISIEANGIEPYMRISYDYEDLRVFLEVFLVTNYLGDAKCSEGQVGTWVSIEQITSTGNDFPFPEANDMILEKLMSLDQRRLATSP